MNQKPKALQKGDKIAIVSLSLGLLGKEAVKHEVDIAITRLRAMGLNPVIMPNADKGIAYLNDHPEARAADLKAAFMNPDIRGILCAIGGVDTWRTFPFLMEDNAFIDAVRRDPKVFVGFSDTTGNHLMLNKLGLSTFYGPSLIADIAELDNDMLPYTKQHFMRLFGCDTPAEITSSPVWYEDRKSYGPEMIGIPRISHEEQAGYITLQGSGVKEGRLFGGCIESLYDALTSATFEDEAEIYKKYSIFPDHINWEEKLLFLETSERQSSPAHLKEMLTAFKEAGILTRVQGIIVGKPAGNCYFNEYQAVWKEVMGDTDVPVLFNVNFGHCVPRCVLPYDRLCRVDYDKKTIVITEPWFV